MRLLSRILAWMRGERWRDEREILMDPSREEREEVAREHDELRRRLNRLELRVQVRGRKTAEG